MWYLYNPFNTIFGVFRGLLLESKRGVVLQNSSPWARFFFKNLNSHRRGRGGDRKSKIKRSNDRLIPTCWTETLIISIRQMAQAHPPNKGTPHRQQQPSLYYRNTFWSFRHGYQQLFHKPLKLPPRKLSPSLYYRSIFGSL